MMCQTCDHEHESTEQAVRIHHVIPEAAIDFYMDTVEDTMLICSVEGCYCPGLDPTDYEDRIALIKAGEIDP